MTFHISQTQIHRIDDAQFDQFVARLHALLAGEGLLPEQDEQDPYRDVDRLVARARQLGLESELAITRYAILAALFGDGLEGIRDRPWFSVLSPQGGEPRDPDWMERVFETVVGNLQDKEA